ncbi:hypothetical protein [Bradyrhizobium sp. USDA 3256]
MSFASEELEEIAIRPAKRRLKRQVQPIKGTHPVSTPGRRADQPWRSGGSGFGLSGRLPIPRE